MTSETFDERLIWLLQVSRSMLATRDLDRLLGLIIDAFIELTEADRGVLLLYDRGLSKLVPKVAHTAQGSSTNAEPRISTVAEQVYREKAPIYATDTSMETSLAARRSIHDLKLKMMVCVPLATESETLGVIYADGKHTLDKVFTHTNRRSIEMLAEHAAAAIDNARMFERTTNDALTGLPNQGYFILQLAKVMREAKADTRAGLLLLDLDAFKRINQAAGAEMGDRALMDIASSLQDTLRADGLVARYGSDKFAVLLPPDRTDVTLRLYDAAERARAAVATKNYHGIQMTASIGAIGFPAANTPVSANDLVALADDVLAKARAKGGNQIEVG